MALRELIRKNVSVVPTTASLKDAAAMMYHDHVGSVLVVDRTKNPMGRPVGIITDRDVTMAMGMTNNLDPKMSVKDFMSKNLLMCSEDDGLYETISKMKTNGIRRIPVLDKQSNLAGIICADDVLLLLSKELNDLSAIIGNELSREEQISVAITPDHQMIK